MNAKRWASALFVAAVMAGGATPAAARQGGCQVSDGGEFGPCPTNNGGTTVSPLATVPEPGVLELLGMGVAGAIAVRLITRRRK
jgi:hypothetical protein